MSRKTKPLTSPLPPTAALGTITAGVQSCTTVLVGKAATADGSVLMATSCDGNIMGRVYAQPAKEYGEDGSVEMFYDFPAPSTWEAYIELMERGDTTVGRLPIEQSYRCIFAAGHLADSITGGLNEHGLSMGIEYLGMKPALANRRGRVSTCSSHWTTSLIANGLLRARTAREAIYLMGAMVEEYGFTYYWAPTAGCAIPIVDGQEAWIMEIFGPGEDWTPESGEPGAVWCAQRVPDGEATCNANRSRIGEVDLDNTGNFICSPNIHSLAEALGLWQPSTPFLWYEAYGMPGDRGNSLREWAALNTLAPSLGLQVTGDAQQDRYPFSVRPDEAVSVQVLASLLRDGYEGTDFDVTEHKAFQVDGTKSPLARPFGSRELFELVGIEPERCIGTETSGYVYIAQIRHWLPDAIAGCLWFTLGPSYTSCFAPIYASCREITDTWSRKPNFTQVDRSQVQWKFQLVAALAELRYQDAMGDIKGVFGPAEATLLTQQNGFEAAVLQALESGGEAHAEALITEYTRACLASVDDAYDALVDYLLFRYLYHYPGVTSPELPRVSMPTVPS